MHGFAFFSADGLRRRALGYERLPKPIEAAPASPPPALESMSAAEAERPLDGDVVVPSSSPPAQRRSRTRPFFERLHAGQIAFGTTLPHAGYRAEISRAEIVKAFSASIEDVRQEKDGTIYGEIYGEFVPYEAIGVSAAKDPVGRVSVYLHRIPGLPPRPLEQIGLYGHQYYPPVTSAFRGTLARIAAATRYYDAQGRRVELPDCKMSRANDDIDWLVGKEEREARERELRKRDPASEAGRESIVALVA